jgi:tetratricopeptide (TPR) repeat protein/transcriptional regulator with XRE-family HTH domain
MGRPERQLPDDETPLTDFARRLRKLRHSAGNPSYRQLAAVTHYSASTLARVASGHALPSLEVTLAFAAACGGDAVEWRDAWAKVATPAGSPESATALSFPDPPAHRVSAAGRSLVWGAPAQLPPDTADFTGRDEQARLLREVLTTHPAGEQQGAVAIAVVTGMGGIGKTTLAVHAAHHVHHQFPDGQIFASLRGTTPVPADPATLLATFLRQLGADPADLPVSTEERGALYRSLLAERRILILLDDALDAAQVRPLIPGTSGCAVLITMRYRVSGLAGATHLHLEPLPRQDASTLLGRIAGAGRVAAEPRAASAILSACGDLPLAIRLAGARLASRPAWSVQDLADRLDAARRRLDELRFADQDLRAGFEVSYASLSMREAAPAPAARAFCLLGLWTGQDIGLPAAASLLGEDIRKAEPILEHLVDMHLVESFEPGRYRMHELLRAFAAERAEQELSGAARTAAITRLITWYTLAANAMDAVVAPKRRRIDVQAVPGIAPPPDLLSPTDAVKWGENEHANLLSACRLSRSSGLRQLAWQLPTALWGFFRLQRQVRSMLDTQEIALASTLESKNEVAEAMVHNNLATALILVGRYEDAIKHLDACVTVRISLGDESGTDRALNNLGIASMEAGLPDQAVGYMLRSLAYREAAGLTRDQADSHANLGNIYLLMGRFTESIAHCESAQRLYDREAETGEGRAEALLTMSRAYHGMGDLGNARRRAEAAVVAYRNIYDQHGTAASLRQLGIILHEAGDPVGARKAWRESASTLRLLNDPGAAEVEALIATSQESEASG